MSEKRMLIVAADLARKIDENRGDMSQAEFINFLIDSQLKQIPKEGRHVTHDALREFEQDIKDLLRNFLEFVVSYGLQLGEHPASGDLEDLSQRLKLSSKAPPSPRKGVASKTEQK